MSKPVVRKVELTRRIALAQALCEKGASTRSIMLESGLSARTICRIRTGNLSSAKSLTLSQIEAARKTVEQYRTCEVDKLSRLTERVLDHALSEDGERRIGKASLREVAAATKDLIEKRELLTGRPTQRVEDRLTDAEIMREIRRCKEELSRLGGFMRDVTPKQDDIEPEYTEVEE